MSMNEGQKARTRTYLDEFKQKNGGCILCQRKISDYVCNPDVSEDGKVSLLIYGCCEYHNMISNSDRLIEEKVVELRTTAEAKDDPANVILMVVKYEDNGEEICYACEKTGIKKSRYKKPISSIRILRPAGSDGTYEQCWNNEDAEGYGYEEK